MKEISGFLAKEMNKVIISSKNNSTVNSISKFALETASSFGLENELKKIKEIGENPEKLVDDIAGIAKEGLIDPSTIERKLVKARDEMVSICA